MKNIEFSKSYISVQRSSWLETCVVLGFPKRVWEVFGLLQFHMKKLEHQKSKNEKMFHHNTVRKENLDSSGRAVTPRCLLFLCFVGLELFAEHSGAPCCQGGRVKVKNLVKNANTDRQNWTIPTYQIDPIRWELVTLHRFIQRFRTIQSFIMFSKCKINQTDQIDMIAARSKQWLNHLFQW